MFGHVPRCVAQLQWGVEEAQLRASVVAALFVQRWRERGVEDNGRKKEDATLALNVSSEVDG